MIYQHVASNMSIGDPQICYHVLQHVHRSMDLLMDGRMDGRTDGRTDGWVNGWTDKLTRGGWPRRETDGEGGTRGMGREGEGQ